MPIFDYEFIVEAPRRAVVDFHHDTSVLKQLMPPPIMAQIHNFEPLGEGSKANFTLWFGFVPVHWKVIHNDVDDDGFTDTQIRGPLKRWKHTHRFTPLGDSRTKVSEHIEYDYKNGFWGLAGRLLFSKPALYFLFTARKILTKRQIRMSSLENEK
jgi:ligand-binding SRPBCC domain-containing protein